MGSGKRLDLWVIFGVLVGCLGMCSGYRFYVGGRDGWVINPSENYTHWAQRNRFQVNDTLCFRYEKGRNSVLVVTKQDYYTCNSKNPIVSLTDGHSLFRFDRSGPFFFVSGHSHNCFQGQKLIVVVMAVRNGTGHHHHHHQQPSPTLSISPSPAPAFPVPAAAMQPPLGSPAVNPSHLEAPAVAPAPVLARNLGSVCSVVSYPGVVLAVLMSRVVELLLIL